jgi:Flp pilus assembly CpaF family ATPase
VAKERLYSKIAVEKPLFTNLLLFIFRYSCTVLAFGQTGSGKTYTLNGPVNLVIED